MLEGEFFHEGGLNVVHKRSCLFENRVGINKAWLQLQKYCNTSYYVEYVVPLSSFICQSTPLNSSLTRILRLHHDLFSTLVLSLEYMKQVIYETVTGLKGKLKESH